ncbi:MAG: tRNA (guanosine(37)-N1)-methyltransferase TrmD [Proteobacteria bacterium]|nr:tRNA (guanosine(37)-N1)-methyltransferase TrmD [Pseudomonadota bacterium]
MKVSMTQINVITLFPEMIENATQYGLLGQCLRNQLLSVTTLNPRTFTSDVHKTVDDRPFGGGDGMVMLAEPLKKAVLDLRAKDQLGRLVYLSPQGRAWNNQRAEEFSKERKITLVCGRYGGVDQRWINWSGAEEVSIGDYVLNGGELGALVMIESLSRFLPGALGHDQSAHHDSFHLGVLEEPQFTRPRDFEGEVAPEILFGGHHAKIQDWKASVRLLVTLAKRPDLMTSQVTPEQKRKAAGIFLLMTSAEKAVLGLSHLSEEEVLKWKA